MVYKLMQSLEPFWKIWSLLTTNYRSDFLGSSLTPGVGLPISLLERRANKKTREKGRSLETRNARAHAFRGTFSSDPRDKGLNLEPRNPRVHASRGNFSSGYTRDKGLCLT